MEHVLSLASLAKLENFEESVLSEDKRVGEV
jgi:hypothetical protein